MGNLLRDREMPTGMSRWLSRTTDDQAGGARAWKEGLGGLEKLEASIAGTMPSVATNATTGRALDPPCAPANGANEAHSRQSVGCCPGAPAASLFNPKCLSACSPAADCAMTSAIRARKTISDLRVRTRARVSRGYAD
jgi:hypothetical protein